MRIPLRARSQVARTRPYLARKAKNGGQIPSSANDEHAANDEHESTQQTAPAPAPAPAPASASASAPEDDVSSLPVTPDQASMLDAATVVATKHCAWCAHEKQLNEMAPIDEAPTSCVKCLDSICHACLTRYMVYHLGLNMQGFYCWYCGHEWESSFVLKIVGPVEVEKYQERMTHKALERNPHFRWCASDTCTSGQFYGEEADQDPKVCCGACGSINCFRCRHTYHHDISCEEFQDPDLRKHRTLRDTKTKKAMRQDDTRRCPHCGTAIERISGCNHVYCITCGQDFDFDKAALC